MIIQKKTEAVWLFKYRDYCTLCSIIAAYKQNISITIIDWKTLSIAYVQYKIKEHQFALKTCFE